MSEINRVFVSDLHLDLDTLLESLFIEPNKSDLLTTTIANRTGVTDRDKLITLADDDKWITFISQLILNTLNGATNTPQNDLEIKISDTKKSHPVVRSLRDVEDPIKSVGRQYDIKASTPSSPQRVHNIGNVLLATYTKSKSNTNSNTNQTEPSLQG